MTNVVIVLPSTKTDAVDRTGPAESNQTLSREALEV